MDILQSTSPPSWGYGKTQTSPPNNTAPWLFYLAFLLFEMPHAYLMQRLPTAKYLGGCVCAWGTVGKLTPNTQTQVSH